jgi:hypothetical protein
MAYDPKQIAAVRKVLYEPTRLRTLLDHVASIDTLMNLDPSAPRHQRKPGEITPDPGTGPNWFIRSNGKISPFVVEAADRCDKVAGLLLEIRAGLAQVSFAASDKQHLSAALAEQAEAFRARGAAWRAPGRPANAKATAAAIAAHEVASIRDFERVTQYLKQVNHP